MKSTLKRLLSGILSLIFVLSSFSALADEEDFGGGFDEEIKEEFEDPNAGYEEDEEEQVVTEGNDKSVQSEGLNILFDLDFNEYSPLVSDSSGLSSSSGSTFFPENIDAEHGTSLAVQTVGNAYFIQNMDTPLTSGCYNVSIDIRASKTTGRMHMRTATAKGTYNEIFGRETTSIGMYPGLVGYSLTTMKKSFAANTWYTVDIWFDLDNRKVYMGIDNVITESYNMPVQMTDISLINVRSLANSDPDVVHYYDNFRMVQANEKGLEMLKAEGKTIPEPIIADLSCKLTSENIGNIFYDFDSVALSGSIMNKKATDYNGKAVYTAYASNGDVTWTSEENISLKPGATHNFTLKPQVLKMDIYTLNISVYPDENPENVFEFEREFSVANRMKGKNKNRRFGIVSHNQNLDRTQPEESFPLMDALGIGYIREAFYLSYMSQDSSGNYAYTGDRGVMYQKMYDYCKKYNIKILAFTSGYGDPGGTPAEQEDFKARMTSLVRSHKEDGLVVAYQFGNEINNKNRQNTYSFEKYVAQLKVFYETVKAENPEALVIACSTSRADAGWIEGILRAGAGAYCDGVSFHPYTGSAAPENQNWRVTAGQVRERVTALGYPDLQLWATEANVTSSGLDWVTEQQQGENLVRLYAQNLAYNPTDVLITYQLQTRDYDQSYSEDCFGIIRGWSVDNKYGAKPGFLAAANYHAMMEDHEYKEYKNQDHIYLYKHESLVDSTDTFMMYADREIAPVSINFGVNEGTLYDIYGNSTKLYSDDGVFTFFLTDSPCYFKANDTTAFEIVESKIKADTTLLEMPAGNRGEYNLTFDTEYAVALDAKDTLNAKALKTETGIKVTVNPEVLPEKVDYAGRVHTDGTDFMRDYVNLTLTKGGKTYAVVKVGVNYLKKAVETDIKFKPYNANTNKHFVGIVEVKNLSDNPVSGNVTLVSPASLVEEFGTKRVTNLGTGEIAEFKFNIPATMNGVSTKYTAMFKADDGTEYPCYMGSIPRSTQYTAPGAVMLKVIPKTDTPPTLDGKVMTSEWQGALWGTFGESDIVTEQEELVIDGVVQKAGELGRTGVKSDFGGELYAMCDDKYLYAAAVVVDDIHYQKEQPVAFFKDDVFSVYTKPTTTQRHDTRFDFALSDFYGYPYGFLNWSPIWDSYYSREIPKGADDVDYNITREGSTTTYEVKIPWNQLFYGEITPKHNIRLALAVHDYDEFRDKTINQAAWICLAE